MPGKTLGVFENIQNRRLIAKLQDEGEDLVLFPCVTAMPIDAAPPIELGGVDWIVFSDINCVDLFIARVREKFLLDEKRVCALGESISDTLRFSQLHADVIPSGNTPGAVFAAIEEYESPENLNFLILKEKTADLELTRLLQKASATANELVIYECSLPADSTRARTLMLGGAVDEFLFTSSADVFDLTAYSDPENWNFTCSSTDEMTRQTLREFGIQLTQT